MGLLYFFGSIFLIGSWWIFSVLSAYPPRTVISAMSYITLGILANVLFFMGISVIGLGLYIFFI